MGLSGKVGSGLVGKPSCASATALRAPPKDKVMAVFAVEDSAVEGTVILTQVVLEGTPLQLKKSKS